MASRCRSLTKPAVSLFKSTICKPTLKPTSLPSLPTARSSLASTSLFGKAHFMPRHGFKELEVDVSGVRSQRASIREQEEEAVN